jgi:ribosomal-protein-alanine N-acetyltransferase
VTLVPLTPEALDEVAAIEQQGGDVGWTRVQFEKELSLPMSRFFVGLEEDNILGYGGFWKVGDDAQITNLVIHPSQRNQGHGRHLLKGLLEQAHAEGCKRMLLEVRSRNAAAQALYKKAGFMEQGRRRNVYSNPKDDAILMERML